MSDNLSAECKGIKFDILHPNESPVVRVAIPRGCSVYGESGAMVSMSSAIKVEGKIKGGVLKSLTRKFLTGETFFFQTLKAESGDGEVLLAPVPPGEIVILNLEGSLEYLVQKGSFLAASEGIKLETTMQNLTKGLFSGEGFFISRISGEGVLVLNSFGAIHRVDLPAGEEYVVDNHHLVAWTSTSSYRIEKASSMGWISSFTSGEGLVCRFQGPGTVYLQTRNPSSFGGWMGDYVPDKK